MKLTKPTGLLLGGTLGVALSTPAAGASDTEPMGDEHSEFCEAFVALEQAFVDAPETDDPEVMGAYANEQIVPNLELAGDNVPAEIAEPVGVILGTVEEVLGTGDTGLFFSPEFNDAIGVAYPAIGTTCALPTIDVSMVDYAFGGVPETIDAGVTMFLLHNLSEAGELHELALIKLAEGVELSAAELFELPDDEADGAIEWAHGSVATPDGISGMIVDLTAGRYVFACFIPVGTTLDEDGEGPPHFVEGMLGEFTVEDGS